VLLLGLDVSALKVSDCATAEAQATTVNNPAPSEGEASFRDDDRWLIHEMMPAKAAQCSFIVSTREAGIGVSSGRLHGSLLGHCGAK